MNAIATMLNALGTSFVVYALRMLVQSGILVAILLLLNLALRRKARATVRYWLWMLVLVKLMLPPTFSLPTGPGYWLGMSRPRITTGGQPSAMPAPDASSVSILEAASEPYEPVESLLPAPYSLGERVDTEPLSSAASRLPAPPAQTVTWQATVLLVWCTIAAAMVLLLVQRSLFVMRLVAKSKEADGRLKEIFEACQRRMNIGRPVRLRLSHGIAGPAACGLLRPVVIIPQSLAVRLNAQHLRAVLLHELAHIGRGDMWVNFLQTLLQVVHFYNPSLWLANHLIRRTREQAVDETVLVAMGDDAEEYPNALVKIARLFPSRPTPALRLVGIVESRKALSQRIRHIVSRPAPESAKIGMAGLAAVCVAAALLLPMARGAKATDHADRTDVAPNTKLRKSPGVSGTVLIPSGEPAIGADIALSTRSCTVTVSNGFLEGGIVAQTDKTGAFSLPPEDGRHAIIAVHEQGYAEVFPGDATDSTSIQLQPWGKVAGKLSMGAAPSGNERIVLVSLSENLLKFQYDTTTRSDGTFLFERVVPGDLLEVVHDDEGGKEHWWAGSGRARSSRTEVRAGETVRVAIGGDGRPVTGTILPPAGYDEPIHWPDQTTVTLDSRLMLPKPKDYQQMSRDQKRDWNVRWWGSGEGKKRQRAGPRYGRYHSAQIHTDGGFLCDDVPPGDYKLNIRLGRKWKHGAGRTIGTLQRRIRVPEPSRVGMDAPFELGELKLAAEDGRHFVVCENAGNGLSIYNISGRRVSRVDGKFGSARISGDRVYALTRSNLKLGSDLVVLDLSGNILRQKPIGGHDPAQKAIGSRDLAVDAQRETIWVVGADIKKCDMNLNIVKTLDIIVWAAVSVDLNPDGSVWVAEPSHSQVRRSKDRLLRIGHDGVVQRTVELVIDPRCLRVDKKSGAVWVTGYAGTWKFNSAGTRILGLGDEHASTVDVDPFDGSVWVGGKEGVSHYSSAGKELGIYTKGFNFTKYVAVAHSRRP